MSIIDAFYRGQITPLEDFGYSDNPDYKSLMKKTRSQADELSKTLNLTQKELFTSIQLNSQALHNIEMERMFSYAFRLGIQFGAETYKE